MTASRLRILVPVLIAVLVAIGAGGTWYWRMSAPPPPSALAGVALPEGFKPVEPPMQMGGFAFQDADGNTVRLADFKGRPVLLNIWAKWCAPCLAEMPTLNQLQADAAPGTLAVVAVAVDEPNPAKVRDFLANRRWDALKPYLDPKNVFAKALEIKAIPVSLLIDKNGFALVRVDAPVDWYSAEAISLLKQTIL
ncbi:TlpA family protein disulfide reductase [Dongia sp.]|uniref:TlpA family protein disulfide reductase n=1 Tax=Dongia sp. TaxID=1977262 RepID=UPI00375019D7